MILDYATLDSLRSNHPAWRLLLADSAPLVVSFLHRVYVVPNVRVMTRADLVEQLEDELYRLNETLKPKRYPKKAAEYLDDWAADDRGWLRKFYPLGSDEPHFDLTPATEKALTWLESLMQRSFVGTESRLITIFELLRQIVEGSEIDPQVRIQELEKRRAAIDKEIAALQGGEVSLLGDAALKDRFQQLANTARELLSDFREVEQNFRLLDRKVRERIATWERPQKPVAVSSLIRPSGTFSPREKVEQHGLAAVNSLESKGALLGEILSERDAIADSDQGASFRAFWDFLMSSTRQDELSRLLDKAIELPAIQELKPDARLRRIHYDWLEAGEHTQRTVALLSQQLRRFLDDQAWLENRRIIEILRSIEARALAVRDTRPIGPFLLLEEAAPSVELPMERPLFSPPFKPTIVDQIVLTGKPDFDTEPLFSPIVIDRTKLLGHIRQMLNDRTQATLGEIVARYPLTHGLAELVSYLQLASEDDKALFDEDHREHLRWRDEENNWRQAQLPRVIFVR